MRHLLHQPLRNSAFRGRSQNPLENLPWGTPEIGGFLADAAALIKHLFCGHR